MLDVEYVSFDDFKAGGVAMAEGILRMWRRRGRLGHLNEGDIIEALHAFGIDGPDDLPERGVRRDQLNELMGMWSM